MDAAGLTDPIPLARALIRRRSITPADGGALDVLGAALAALGFRCRRMPFEDVDNLFATRGEGRPHLVYCGHTDVVPPGDEAAWRFDPFAAEIAEGALWGRGAADMKSGVAAFVAAIARSTPWRRGALSLLITGDEEGPAQAGVKAMLPVLAAEGVRFDHGLGGEPTSAVRLGDVVKVGRRGSLNGVVTAAGRQGHVAYPQDADNPIPVLLAFLHALQARNLDQGYPDFEPSNLEVTSIDVGNPAHNVIPARAQAKFNIRFNPNHTGASLCAWLEGVRAAAAAARSVELDLRLAVTGEPFHTPPGPWSDLVARAVEAETGLAPALTTGGGTSDCRFLKDHAPCVEFGLLNATIHQVNEHAPLSDIEALASIYARILSAYEVAFAG
jgi:succinyl-diaminopimelate desuccinylase